MEDARPLQRWLRRSPLAVAAVLFVTGLVGLGSAWKTGTVSPTILPGTEFVALPLVVSRAPVPPPPARKDHSPSLVLLPDVTSATADATEAAAALEAGTAGVAAAGGSSVRALQAAPSPEATPTPPATATATPAPPSPAATPSPTPLDPVVVPDPATPAATTPGGTPAAPGVAGKKDTKSGPPATATPGANLPASGQPVGTTGREEKQPRDGDDAWAGDVREVPAAPQPSRTK